MATKMVKVWEMNNIQTRHLAEHATSLSLSGAVIFGVYPSLVAGSFDVLSYRTVAAVKPPILKEVAPSFGPTPARA